MIEQDVFELKARVSHLEVELGALKGVLQNVMQRQAPDFNQPRQPGPANQFFDPMAAEAAFRQAVMTLKTMADLRHEPFIFIAAADPHNVATSGPQPVQALLNEEVKGRFVKLGAALSNLPRLKMLFVLQAQEECTTALLAEASGVSGGNLFQQLNELYSANLIFQPSRGRYRLTDSGRLLIEVLAWVLSSDNPRPAQPGWFENNPE
jgi:hypothetical protein